MGSLERKLARRQTKDIQKQLKKEMSQRVGLFNLLPDHCFGCSQPFDKKDRQQVFTWNVRVYEEAQEVKLYCPVCYKRTAEVSTEPISE
tara:strand:- start:542 stop:808 length:267 start_codon:yes stop_codon:yes gene_type:complete